MAYYDPYPLVTLDRPLCLIGFMGCDVHSICYFIASLTGLPSVEVDKLIEHKVGMSLAQLYLERGEEEWRRLEEHFLEKTLDMQPARLICLGDGALINPHNRSLCIQKSEVVYIRRPQRSLLKRVQKGRQEFPQRFPLWVNRELHSFEELQPLLDERIPTYESAHTLVDIGELSALEASQRIIKRLKLNTSVV